MSCKANGRSLKGEDLNLLSMKKNLVRCGVCHRYFFFQISKIAWRQKRTPTARRWEKSFSNIYYHGEGLRSQITLHHGKADRLLKGTFPLRRLLLKGHVRNLEMDEEQMCAQHESPMDSTRQNPEDYIRGVKNGSNFPCVSFMKLLEENSCNNANTLAEACMLAQQKKDSTIQMRTLPQTKKRTARPRKGLSELEHPPIQKASLANRDASVR